MAAKIARRHSKRRPGGERQRAPNVTHTMVSETRAPEVRELVIYFEHRVKTRKVVPDLGAPNVTNSVISGTWAPLSAACCDKTVASFVTWPK